MSGEPQGRAEIRSLLDAHGHLPNKSFGQNFLSDPNTVRKIIELADIDGRDVIEVGAGTGTLTVAIAARARRVIAYEIDRNLEPILDAALGDLPNVTVRYEDASRALSGAADGDRWVMVANLPYNVGTAIVLDALRFSPWIERFVVMVQREVGDRLLAGPGSKVYGLPSVVVGLHARGRHLMSVPPTVFEPPPTVESTVIELVRVDPPVLTERAIEIASVAFGQRRKMIRRSLAPVFADLPTVLERAGIDGTTRPEQLSPDDYVALARGERSA